MSDQGTPPLHLCPGGYGVPAYGGVPGTTPPPNYLVWAILTTVFCCLPLGVVSIVYAAQVNSKWAMGDAAGALDSSVKAKKWAIWSMIVQVVVIVVAIVLLVILAMASTTSP